MSNLTKRGTSDQEMNEDMRILEAHANALMEHFSSVQIFVTRPPANPTDGTVRAHTGQGDWYARYGLVRSWICREEGRMRDE